MLWFESSFFWVFACYMHTILCQFPCREPHCKDNNTICIVNIWKQQPFLWWNFSTSEFNPFQHGQSRHIFYVCEVQKKKFSSNCITLRIFRLDGKQCRSRWGGLLWATSIGCMLVQIHLFLFFSQVHPVFLFWEFCRSSGKHCRPWSDCSLGAVWSGSTLFAVAFLSIFFWKTMVIWG